MVQAALRINIPFEMLLTPVFRVSGEQPFTRFWCGQVPKPHFPFLLLQAQAAGSTSLSLVVVSGYGLLQF
jgi:hypothetical protein